MPRAERAKRKVDPLVEHGRKVFLSYEGRGFEKRQVTRTYGRADEHSYTYTKDRMPTPELLAWLTTHAGPRRILWATEKASEGINVYFAVPGQAMMCKLAWGGV